MEYLEQRKNILISQQMPQVLSWIPELLSYIRYAPIFMGMGMNCTSNKWYPCYLCGCAGERNEIRFQIMCIKNILLKLIYQD